MAGHVDDCFIGALQFDTSGRRARDSRMRGLMLG
jgi:hypothetical protein